MVEVDSEISSKLSNNICLKVLPNTVLSPMFGKVNYSWFSKYADGYS